MVQIQRLYVPGRNGTYSDDLVVLGLADLLSELMDDTKISISRQGDGFIITLPRSLDTERMPVDAYPYEYICFDDKDKDPPIDHISYQALREQEKIRQAYEKSLQKPKKIARLAGAAVAAPAVEADNAPERPRPDLSLFKAMNSMRKGSSSYQDVWRAWMALSSDDRRRILTARLIRLADDLDDTPRMEEPPAAKSLAKAVRALQFYDPLIGKGSSRPKPNGASSASYDSGRVDWFDEFLKYRAMHVGMVAYSTGNEGADTRVLVLAPQDIPVGAVRAVRRDLLQAPIFGNLQSEIKAVITATRSLIQHSDVLNPGSAAPAVVFARRTPAQILAGLNTAYFLSLGSRAYAPVEAGARTRAMAASGCWAW